MHVKFSLVLINRVEFVSPTFTLFAKFMRKLAVLCKKYISLKKVKQNVTLLR